MVTADDGVEIPGVGLVEKGTKVSFSLWGAHHDEKDYPDAFRWKMSRWVDDARPLFGNGGVQEGRGQYIPFGYRKHGW